MSTDSAFPLQESSHARPLLTLAIATSTITTSLMAFAAFARLAAKAFVVKRIHLEDYALIFALVGVAAWTSLYLAARAYGLGFHMEDVPVEDLPRFLYLCDVAEIIYGPVTFAAKWSVLLQQKRIFTPMKTGGVYWTIQTLIYMTLAFYLATTLSLIFQCWPREAIWNLGVGGVCIDSRAATFSCGVIKSVIRHGHIGPATVGNMAFADANREESAPYMPSLARGLLPCVMGSMGVAYRAQLLHSIDFTYIITQVGLWTLAEFCAVIVVGCMPSIPQFFRFVTGNGKPSTTRVYPYTGDDLKRSLARRSKGNHANETYVDPETTSHDVSSRYLQLVEH